MERRWWWRFFIVVVCTIMAGIYVYPTVGRLDLKTTNFPFKKKVNLGLDLQGGLYLVMGVDFDKVFNEFIDRQKISIQSRLDEKKISYKKIEVVRDGFEKDDPRISIEMDSAQHDQVLKLIKDEYINLRLTVEEQTKLHVGTGRDYRQRIRDNTIDQSREVIRNRIDQFGVAEPVITRQGIDRIVVELPGIREIQRAKDLIGRTAKLEFKQVDTESEAAKNLMQIVQDIEKEHQISYDPANPQQKFSEYVGAINKNAVGKIPEGRVIVFGKPEGQSGPGAERLPSLLFSKVEVSGEELIDARVAFNQENRRPEVAFTLNPKGAQLFADFTGANIGKQLAIVLDNALYSAPVIQSRIPGGRGVITLGQGNQDQMMKEAKDLALVLRAGALPAQLEFLEQRVVGPSLGQDSIKKGGLAGVIGTLLVFLFIAIYYRGSGMIAVASLALNVVFVMAVLVGLEATLTLPGIAGIALTVGIAVDSNVVIFERIREEIRAGKAVHGAVESGFQKAFRTIFDANLTNAGAALVLLNFGSGPIKGFAVTMLIGIICTLFTAVFVCRMFFEFYLKSGSRGGAQKTSLSI